MALTSFWISAKKEEIMPEHFMAEEDEKNKKSEHVNINRIKTGSTSNLYRALNGCQK